MHHRKEIFLIVALAAVISLSWASEQKEVKDSPRRDVVLDQYSFYDSELDIPELKKTLQYERPPNKILLDLLGKTSKEAQTLTDEQILTAFNAALDIRGLPDKMKINAGSQQEQVAKTKISANPKQPNAQIRADNRALLRRLYPYETRNSLEDVTPYAGGSDGEMEVTIKKPAIYLYPETDLTVTVKLAVQGKITSSKPLYGSGWTIQATRAGLIDGQYDYLFYEAQLDRLTLPAEGWVVAYGEIAKWFDATLPQLGLNQKEKDQFKEYWLRNLPKCNYLEIKLLEDSFLKEHMNLVISPSPTTIIRLNFHFQPLDKPSSIVAPKITTPTRKGFVVVEWGGVVSASKNIQ
jgi:hypothetical protein